MSYIDENPMVYIILSKSYLELKDYKRADSTADIILKKDYTNSMGWLLKANVQFEYKNYEKSLEYCNNGLYVNPRLVDLLNQKADCYVELDELDKAEKYFLLSVESDSSRPYAWNQLYMISRMKDDYEKCFYYLDKAINNNPDNPYFYFNRACTYALMGKKDEMIKDLKKAIEIDLKFQVMAVNDEDFKSFRNDPDFIELI